MASQKRDMQTTQNKITTEEILAKLKDDKDHTEFFYLYVSTSEDDTTDEEGSGIKKRRLLDTTAISHNGNSECSSSREDNDVGETGQVDNTESAVADNNPGVQNDQKATDNARSKAMKRVHETIQTEVLYPREWKKVCDKDWKPTYRAFYFKTIEKTRNEKESGKEGDIKHMQRVNEIRKEVQKAAEKVMDDSKVKFKINSLLSRPLLYDEKTLEEQLTSLGSTHKEQHQN